MGVVFTFKILCFIWTIQCILVAFKMCSNTYSRLITSNISMYMSACQILSNGIGTNHQLCGQKCLHESPKCPAFVLNADTCWICQPRTVLKHNAKSLPGMEELCDLEVYIKKGWYLNNLQENRNCFRLVTIQNENS